MAYFRGQGELLLGRRDSNGNPLALRWVGNCPELKLGLNIDYLEHQESYTGQGLTDVKKPLTMSTELSFILEEFSKENLAMALAGTANSIAAGTAITGEVLNGSATPTVGDYYIAAKRNGTGIVLKDSTGTPKTLTLNTNYSVEPYSMTVKMLNTTTGGPFTGPLKIDYTPGVSTEIAMFNSTLPDYFLMFKGMNMLDEGRIVDVVLYRVQISPTEDLSMIGNEVAQLPISGAALIDLTKPSSNLLGQFGAIYMQS